MVEHSGNAPSLTPLGGRLHRVWKKWFWNAYDHAGTLVAVNLLWVLGSLLLITLPASTAGLFYVTSRMAAYREVRLRDFFVGCRDYHWRSLRLCGLYGLAAAVLAVNVWFYGRLAGSWQWAGVILGGGMIWGMAFIGLTGVYAFPLLVQTDETIRVIVKKSVLLVLDNLWYTGALGGCGVVVLVIGGITGAGVVLGAVAVVSLLFSTGLREVLKKYAPLEREGADQFLPQPATDPEEPRGWRDLIRPWE